MDKIMIDDWIDELPIERHLIVTHRACKALGLDCEWQSDGHLQIEEGFDHDELEEAMGKEFQRMYATELLEQMAEDGDIVPDSVDEDGHVVYVAC